MCIDEEPIINKDDDLPPLGPAEILTDPADSMRLDPAEISMLPLLAV